MERVGESACSVGCCVDRRGTALAGSSQRAVEPKVKQRMPGPLFRGSRIRLRFRTIV